MKNRTALILVISFALSACFYTARPTSPVVIQTVMPPIQAFQPVAGQIETLSQTQADLESTEVPRRVPDKTPNIATIIADPDTSFAFAQIYGLAYLENGHLLVTIEVPGGVEGHFFARLGQDIFDCAILEAYPNRLYCNGETTQAGLIVPFLIFSQGDTEAIFETDLGIPPLPYHLAQHARVVDKQNNEESP